MKRTFVLAFLFATVLSLGFISCRPSDNSYALDVVSVLEDLSAQKYMLSVDDMVPEEMILVDIRSPFEFEKGHLNNAINIPAPVILRKENKSTWEEWKGLNKTVVLYGKDSEQANIPFLLLYQVGFDNLKILNADQGYLHNKFSSTPTEVEKPVANIRRFIDESVEKSRIARVEKEIEPVSKEVVPVKKKKKRPVEGGC